MRVRARFIRYVESYAQEVRPSGAPLEDSDFVFVCARVCGVCVAGCIQQREFFNSDGMGWGENVIWDYVMEWINIHTVRKKERKKERGLG